MRKRYLVPVIAVILAVALTVPAFGGTTLAQQVARLTGQVGSLTGKVRSLRGTLSSVSGALSNEDTMIVTTTATSDASGSAEGTAACPSGWLITGGGAEWNSGIQTDSIYSSVPDSDTWIASGHTSGKAGQQFLVYAVCAKLGS